MQNIKVKLDITVNNAVIIPTNEQYARIVRHVKNVVFGNDESVEEKVITKTRWTKEEIDFSLKLLKEGYKMSDIVDKLHRTFGTVRSYGSLWAKLKHKKATVLDKFQPYEETVKV
jgi:hypothetical protein